MQNKKGNAAVIALIVVIVAVTASAITWKFVSQTQTPSSPSLSKKETAVPVSQSAIDTYTPVSQPNTDTSTQIPSNASQFTRNTDVVSETLEKGTMALGLSWREYISKQFYIKIEIPENWGKDRPADKRFDYDNNFTPFDDSYFTGNKDVFEDGRTIVRGQDDSDQRIIFSLKKDYDAIKLPADCQKESLRMHNLFVDKVLCPNAQNGAVPSKLNYVFLDNDFVVSIDKETEISRTMLESIRNINTIVWDERMRNSFMKEKLLGLFSKDNKYVYYEGKKISGADPNTFQAFEFSYAKDANNVYYEGKKISADANSMQWLKGFYIKDKNTAYYQGKKIDKADTGTFEALNVREARDKDYVYYDGKVKEKRVY